MNEKELMELIYSRLSGHYGIRYIYPPNGHVLIEEILSTQAIVYGRNGERFQILVTVRPVPTELNDEELRQATIHGKAEIAIPVEIPNRDGDPDAVPAA